MNILIEGWRKINHSYSLVNEWQIIELIKNSELFFKDVPFISEKWNEKDNSSGFSKEIKDTINKIPKPDKYQRHDVTYRISNPLDFDKNFNSKILFIYGTCEYKYLDKINYKNNFSEKLIDNENIFIHTPSHWSKNGFLNAGFKDKQISVVSHGVNRDYFDLISDENKKDIRKKFNINSESTVLSNIGAMTENKGVEVLISAYGILKKKKKNLKLILKDQSNLYGITTDYLFKKIINSEFNKKFNIVTDEMLNDILIISKNLNLKELKEIYSISDCYVSPYLAEGFNLTPLEAAACGTQIIVTKGGSTDDYFNQCLGYQIESTEIKFNKNAYRLEPKIDSLINILEEKIIDKKDDLKNNRCNYVHKNFSWKKGVKKLKKEFENKLNK